ncbi:uncharacterized protein LOC129303247 isoform X2 [Prosopis cineraria]|uniref:uncharacterized protein LOC129297483 isoform X2 n=1 Tax=Prosopis cineraria TaxID=364024 RepID=UPI00240F753B|nr:uncharacterized protein LOC129297483 isoform X2 [Prosopis cineraria]XP_054798411.1 uncharacterized protein LOC129303247 isoform X2 [Prosopis cineraria]
MEENDVVKTVGVGVISWTLAFVMARRIFCKYSFEFSNRLVSTAHATLAVTLASLSVQDWKCPLCPMASTSTPAQMQTLACGSEMVGALWVTEMSSPFLHLREALKELGYRDTAVNLAADILFASIFTVARMVAGPYITYVTLSANNPPMIKAMGLGLQLVSAFWFLKIVRMMKYKLKKRTMTKHGINHASKLE